MEIKLGTIGSGVIVHSVLDNVKKFNSITLEAVYSRSQEKAQNLANEYNSKKIYMTIDKLLL